MHRHIAAAAVLVLVLEACSPVSPPPTTASTPTTSNESSTPTQEPTHSSAPTAEPSQVAQADCGQVIQVTEPRPSSTRPLAVFSSVNGLLAYDIGDDSVALLDGNASLVGLRPQFRTRGLVSFVRSREQPDASHTFGQDSLYELDLDTRQLTELLRLPNVVHGYAWSPDGTLLAYQVRAETADEVLPISLCVFDMQTGEASVLRSLAYWAGREAHQRDEVAISWSPAGSSVLVIDTIEQPSVYLVGVDGRELMPPRDGSFGRWLSDDTFLLWDDPQAAGETGRWLTVSSSTGETSPFALPADAHRPAVSLDGQMIAFDDGAGAEPSVYVFDIQTGMSRRLGRRLLAPVWLGPDVIAATAAGACPPDNYCVVPWSTLDHTVGINIDTGDRRRLQLPTTMQEQFVYGVIDTSRDIAAR